jgi:hypothetical protein
MSIMKSTIFKGITIFCILLVSTSILMDVTNTTFGTVNFFQRHGIIFLFFITIFPRLTLLFSSVATGGLIWWLGFFFCPRVLIASLATIAYFHTNPILVVISWIVALGGETMEKVGIGGARSKFFFKTYRSRDQQYRNYQDQNEQVSGIKGDVVEAEFTKKN